MIKKVSLLKRNILAVPFLNVAEGKTKNLVVINYRSNEAMYIKPEADSVTVIFSINFKDQGDIVLGKVFLQEFQDCRRSMSGAPAVSFTQRERPLELRDVQGVYEGADQGFVSFGTSAVSSCAFEVWVSGASTNDSLPPAQCCSRTTWTR